METSILLHLIFALPAVIIGLVILTVKKGTPKHKEMGRYWLVLMYLTTLSSFFVQGLGGMPFGFSWIHMLSIFTLFTLTMAIYYVRKNSISLHRNFMIGTYCGLLGAGTAAMFPGRLIPSLLGY